VVASGERGEVQLVAGRDIRLNDVTTAWRDSLVWDADNALTRARAAAPAAR
jgi:filamentous hemagglutinin